MVEEIFPNNSLPNAYDICESFHWDNVLKKYNNKLNEFIHIKHLYNNNFETIFYILYNIIMYKRNVRDNRLYYFS